MHIWMPDTWSYTSKFFALSYYNPDTLKYAIGYDDFYLMATCIVLFTGLRAGVMKYALERLARLWGLSKKKEVIRFSEQSWMLMYYSIFWPMGLVCHNKSPLPPALQLLLTFASTSTTIHRIFSTCRSCGPTGPRESLTG